MVRDFRRRTKDQWERAVDSLDEAREPHAVVSVMANHLFPLDVFIASELAQLKTFAIPTISRLLHATGEYERNGQRRVDDTKAILSGILVPGPQSSDGEEMIGHLNRIHGRYAISNDDLLYTLSALAEEPIAWIERYGWRPLSGKERSAYFDMYMELGRKMNISALPPSYDALVDTARAYERRCRQYAPSNEKVARALLRVIEQEVPVPLRRWVEPVLSSILLDEDVPRALGLRIPSPRFRRAVRSVMKIRQRSGEHVTLWNERGFWDTSFFRRLRTYPNGFNRSRLGPKKIIESLEREAMRRGRSSETSG